MARTAILNPRRTRLLRKTVPPRENVVAGVLAAALLATVAGVLATRGGVDPGLRDLPVELLEVEREKLTLYVPPLVEWRDPAPPATPTAGPALGPFPPALLAGEWSLAGRVRAFDAANLYEKINGEAEKFLGQGFVSMHYAALRHPASGDELAIELYDQGALAGSSGVFAAHGAARRETVERDGVIYFVTPVGVVGRVDRYFFRAAGNRESPRISAKAEQLVALMADRAPREAAGAAPGLAALRAFGVAEAGVQFKPENAFQIDFARDFWFGELEDPAGARVFVHAAPSEAAAGTLLEGLLEEQGFEHEAVAGDARWTVMRHRVLGSVFAIHRRGAFVYGVDRLNDPDRLGSIMETLGGSLPNEEG